jgi:hypothetical protein
MNQMKIVMAIADFIFAVIIALIIGSIFSFGFKRSGPWGAFWIFVLLLFFAALAARLWITPIGPTYYGFAWLPTIFFVFLFALLLSASSEPNYPGRNQLREATAVPEEEIKTGPVLGIFFWIMMVFLLIAIIAGLAR